MIVNTIYNQFKRSLNLIDHSLFNPSPICFSDGLQGCDPDHLKAFPDWESKDTTPYAFDFVAGFTPIHRGWLLQAQENNVLFRCEGAAKWRQPTDYQYVDSQCQARVFSGSC